MAEPYRIEDSYELPESYYANIERIDTEYPWGNYRKQTISDFPWKQVRNAYKKLDDLNE
jgi:hypothetical protein